MNAITIRMLHTPDEMQEAVRLQQVYWGEDMSAIVPTHMLLSLARYGGHVHAAFDGEKMVGMLLGFLGATHGEGMSSRAADRLCIMSKRMVVLPEYRGQKIGEHLKWAQRSFALEQGVQLVQWTYDPLLSRNAYLNLHKLRGVVQEYEEDYFGGAATHPSLSADRVVVNWWVDHPHVDEPSPYTVDHLGAAQVINEVTLNDSNLLAPTTLDQPAADVALVEIPLEFVPLSNIDSTLGREWREHIRAAFRQLLTAGYIAVDFVRLPRTSNSNIRAGEYERGFYVFQRDPNLFHFRTES
jgi:predicted GNAT superfamily acetyltransferase